MSDENKKVKLVIPTKIEVDSSRLSGDVDGSIRFELFPEWFEGQGSIPDPVSEAFSRGARVFVTDSDWYMFLEPEESEKEENLITIGH